MCRSESRLVPGPGAGCGTRTSPRPPGSAAPPAGKRPGSATRGLLGGRKGGVAEGSQRKGRRAERGKVNARDQTGVVSRCRTRAHKAAGQASSVTKATVKVKDSTALTDKKFVTEHTKSVTDGTGNWGGTLNSCA